MSRKKLQWLVPAAAVLGVPLALFSAGSVKDIAEAVGHIGSGYILAFAAATNALALVP
jgi:hypothetical protein